MLPNTRVYISMPTEKVKIDSQKWGDFLTSNENTTSANLESFKLTKEMLYSQDTYDRYVEQIAQLLSTEESTNSR